MANFECLVRKYPTGELQRLIFIDNGNGTFTLTTADAAETYPSSPAAIAAGSGIVVQSVSAPIVTPLFAGNGGAQTVAGGALGFLCPYGGGTMRATEPLAEIIIGATVTVNKFLLKTLSAQGADADLDLSLMKNGASVIIGQVPAAAAAATFTSATVSVTFATGDRMSLRIDNLDSAFASAQIGAFSIQFG